MKLDGPGQDDYEYAVFPSADGQSAVLWANRVADRQITANTKEHGNCRIPGVTPSFVRTEDGFIYQAFLPSARIYPGTVGPNAIVSLGLTVHNADDPAATDDARVKGGLSFSSENSVGHPQRWIEVLLDSRGAEPALQDRGAGSRMCPDSQALPCVVQALPCVVSAPG